VVLSNNTGGVLAPDTLSNMHKLLHYQTHKHQEEIAEYKSQAVKYKSQEAEYKSQEAEYKSQEAEYKSQAAEYKSQIKVLEEQLKLALIKKYGRSTEKYVDPTSPQLSLFGDENAKAAKGLLTEEIDEDEQPDIEIPAHTRKAKKSGSRGKRESLPACLARVRIEYEKSAEDLIAPNGEVYVKIGEEISEQLDIIPADVRVIQHVRFKYALKNQEELGVKIADAPLLPIPKGIASAGLLAHMAEAKFRHHLPLYRQETIWTDLGVNIPRNSMQRWMNTMGEQVQPLIDCLFEEIKSHKHIHADETPVTVLKDVNNKDKNSHKGYMWVYANKNGVVYDYQSSRAGIHPLNNLSDFKGFVQCDAFSGYGCLPKLADIKLVGCWAHARRKFTDVQKLAGKGSSSPIADYAVKMIAKLYKIEKQIKENKIPPPLAGKYREENSIPILKKIHLFLLAKNDSTLPKSAIGRAIYYTLNNWDNLFRYTSNGVLNIDNNFAERQIKPFVVGRKNWLFHGSSGSAKASANIFSLIESAKLYNLKIFDYLKYVFENIPKADTPRKIEQLLPIYAQKHITKIKPKNRG
jgi:transposase